ncbi:unnamed protein product [Tetraodon nigroviridis]|uniref:(spotted green pufferfish) hypothetical protein n=1 Tax=Tetraodon nigroviridis TaxID=99883 RepID=Q4SSU7_TETNG|nr:unnamed protein product [Tetraodon nigroviridis]
MFSAVLLTALGVLAHLDTFTHGCQLPSEWRPLSEGCRAELAEIIVYAKVLAIHREPLGGGTGSLYNSLPFGFSYGYEGAEEGLLYSAEVELLCDQAWGSMLEVPSGSRLNLTGLGMDENYNILPHGVNFQDAIFPDTSENRRTFSSLFQFSNCTQGSQPFHTFSPEWDTQEDSRVRGQISKVRLPDEQRLESASLMCSSVQAALFEEEERGRELQERLDTAERRNRQLKERVRKAKRSLRNARKAARKAEQQARELGEKLKAAERTAGRHLNTITQEEPPPPGRYASAALRQRTQL